MTGVVFDLRAERSNTTIDAAVIDHDVLPPNPVENLVPGQRAARAAGQEFQQPKLFRCENDLPSLAE